MIEPYYADEGVTLYHGRDVDVLRALPDSSINCVVTSPPYFGLRDYGQDGQRGLESSPQEYVAGLVEVFTEVRRVLADDGTCWLNLGDSYASTGGAGGRMAATGLGTHSLERPEARDPQRFGRWNRNWGVPAKNLLGIPWRVAFALQDDGWILRNDIIWSKPNAMPESVTDRLNTRFEHVFLLTTARRYWFDLDAIREPHEQPRPIGRWIGPIATTGDNHGPRRNFPNPLGRNPGDVWTIPTAPFTEAHFAVMPPALAARCIMAGCKPGGTVLDPYSGSGTTGLAATKNGRRYVGVDISSAYLDLSLRTRLAQGALIDDDFLGETL